MSVLHWVGSEACLFRINVLHTFAERFAADPWYLLCSCILMSRVSSSAVKERCIGGFFTACPTPSAMLSCDPATLKPILHSLGTVRRMRVRTRARVWMIIHR
eukprot:TRINITY_DN11979_c1_g3_i4.p3 TRINITY_DN11979_c1_g3~~TRINITY_DN11979_c1_g3_i4.p3  ORF type:complete len:102 (-),score=1.16 TRINITY_DN11979_c1_g3_i4:1194-1499(-)